MTRTPSDLPQEFRTFLREIRRLVLPPQGMTSEVTVVESASGTFVVKRAHHPLFMSWLREEYRALKALEPLSLQIPHAYQLIERTASEGDDCWLLMSHLPGTTLAQRLSVERDPDLRRHIARQWGATLRQIHAAPAPLELVPRAPTWLDDRLQQARFNLEHYPVDGDEALLRSLERHRPAPVPPTLIHGDFTLDNTLVDGDRISGVIDWGAGAYGDPRCDLALGLEAEPGVFDDDAEHAAFWDGYGGRIATEAEYFHNLYEFF
jgi:aminoglycoside phosphotransferase (APT) family kinase protein